MQLVATPAFTRHMKILVVDDDRIARKVLRAFLEDAGYQVATAEDGPQAIAALTGPEAPPIVILDWVMPGMSGPEVCAKVRASQLKLRPYVLMLSAKTDKNEVVAGLDAGADDFLSKPFNLAELLARLRVAQRMVEYEIALHHKLDELEALEQRHRLLGEMIADPNHRDAPPPADGAGGPVLTGGSAAEHQICLSRDCKVALGTAALRQLGLGEVVVAEAPPANYPFRVSYVAWTALIAIDAQRWIDLVIEAEPAVLTKLIELKLGGRSPRELPKQAFLAEALTIVSSALRAELRQRTCDTLMPFLSRALYLERSIHRLPIPDELQPLHLTVAGHSLTVTMLEHAAPKRRKTSTQLRLHDVLADAYPPPHVNEVALLNRGAILNDRYIEKLTAFAEATSEQHPIPVYVPSPLAVFFNREGDS